MWHIAFANTETETALKSMTHNAALDSAVLSLRCFYEFFKPDGRLATFVLTIFPVSPSSHFSRQTTNGPYTNTWLA